MNYSHIKLNIILIILHIYLIIAMKKVTQQGTLYE